MVCVSGGETLFLDVTAQPSLPLLSNTSLLFRGFHRRPAIRKTRSPACRAAGAGRRLPKVQIHTHTHGNWEVTCKTLLDKNGDFYSLILLLIAISRPIITSCLNSNHIFNEEKNDNHNNIIIIINDNNHNY